MPATQDSPVFKSTKFCNEARALIAPVDLLFLKDSIILTVHPSASAEVGA